MTVPANRFVCAAFAVLAACGLSACGTGSGDVASTLMVAPGAFGTYDCTQLENTAKGLRQRISDLEQLMARAAKGPGGELVNAVTYRSDYEYTRGQYNEVVRAAASKNCTAQSPWTSQRSVF